MTQLPEPAAASNGQENTGVGLLRCGGGVSGPQPHPNFVEVLCGSALGGGPRAVEGAGEDDPKCIRSKTIILNARLQPDRAVARPPCQAGPFVGPF